MIPDLQNASNYCKSHNNMYTDKDIPICKIAKFYKNVPQRTISHHANFNVSLHSGGEKGTLKGEDHAPSLIETSLK